MKKMYGKTAAYYLLKKETNMEGILSLYIIFIKIKNKNAI